VNQPWSRAMWRRLPGQLLKKSAHPHWISAWNAAESSRPPLP